MKDLTTDPDSFVCLGARMTPILTANDSAGAMSVTECLQPAADGPPLHIHHAEDEAFMILEGEVDFLVAGRRFRRGPGQGAFVPRGTEHTFRVTDAGPARMLVALTPAGFEQFWAECAANGWTIPADMAGIMACAGRHNLEFTGPPLAA